MVAHISKNLMPESMPLHHAEEILVVPRSALIKENWHGLKRDGIADMLITIQDQQQYHPRWQMEQDPTFKQIIPYLIFMHDDRFFLMQRKGTASEARLQNKVTLGIGGHIRKEDMQGIDIIDWARREFEEEIDYRGSYQTIPLGILNDDTNDVGRVHLGLVLLVQGDSDKIAIRSELQSGSLVSYEECCQRLDAMESWSQIILPHLRDYLKNK